MACRYCEALHHITKSSPRVSYHYCPMCAQNLCPPCIMCGKPVHWRQCAVVSTVGGVLEYAHPECLTKIIDYAKSKKPQSGGRQGSTNNTASADSATDQ